jgi:hypothetical protein
LSELAKRMDEVNPSDLKDKAKSNTELAKRMDKVNPQI